MKTNITLSVFTVVCAFLVCGLALGSTDSSVQEKTTEQLEEFINSITKNMVFVEGGEYLMGDYGVEYGPEKLPYDMDKDSSPLHQVQLSSYSLAKFKVTNQEFDAYLAFSGASLRQDIAEDSEYVSISTPPNNPAHMDWYEAERYCNWLGRISHLPFALPTEAQWEYAARSRGQFLMVATDDGTYKVTDDEITGHWKFGPKGINISTSWDREAFGKKMGWGTGMYTPLPVDRFPPNPLGFYSMSDNGLEWVRDWYDPDYYQYSPIKDPQGPHHPVYKDPKSDNKYTKVLRGAGHANPLWGGGVNVQRTHKSPDGYITGFRPGKGVLVITDKTARCAVNSPTPLN